jgi:hypothetical protein
MPTQLQNPITSPAITNVTVVDFSLRWANGTLSAIIIVYVASDANDNHVPGVQPQLATTSDGPTMTAALTAFYTGNGGHPKLGALAALAVLQPSLVGSVS